MRASMQRTAAVGAGLTFWAALAVLVANDHWLKGSGLLPGWLTGKLSDFAGLIVAPVVLVGLARASRPRARHACIALVALVFAGFELFPSWARALAEWAHLRTWPDPTDLFALAILPLTYWVLKRRSVGQQLRLGPAFLHRLALIAGSVACLATDGEGPPVPPAPYVENRSHLPLELTARRYLGTVDCTAMTLDFDAPSAADFGAPISAVVEPNEQLAAGLDGDAMEQCGAIWLASPQLTGVIFGFRLQRWTYPETEDQNTLIIEGPAAELRAYPGPGIWLVDAPAPFGMPRP
jgi:hypothetical protein